jgi:hypothetical protein
MPGEMPPRRSPISYSLARHAVAVRRFVAEPSVAHRRELAREREAVREDVDAGETLTRAGVAAARQSAAKERARDRDFRLCHCGRCAWKRDARTMYARGFKDGVLGRVGKRRIEGRLRSYKKEFKAGLADGRRALEDYLREFDEKQAEK